MLDYLLRKDARFGEHKLQIAQRTIVAKYWPGLFQGVAPTALSSFQQRLLTQSLQHISSLGGEGRSLLRLGTEKPAATCLPALNYSRGDRCVYTALTSNFGQW